MATTFKTLNSANDVASTRTLLHEAIPLTGTIASGTYADGTGETNIKTYSHGMFESVYDYPYLSSSANHIFDITTGYASNSALAGVVGGVQNSKKLNIYSQMAQVLVGYDATGSIQSFDRDGNIADVGDKINEAIFVNFSRLLTKDEMKKGSFTMSVLTGGAPTGPTDVMTITDVGAADSYKVNSPAGEYGILYTGSAVDGAGVGLIYYQAGVAVLSGSVFAASQLGNGVLVDTGFSAMATGSNIEMMADSFRNRLQNISFNNTVELNSTVYFCRASHNEFNYSNNPTYLSESQIRVKNSTTDNPVSYVTTVGLYSSDNELLAVAKLSEPLKKDPSTEVTLRVRLDF